jgi:hypothetical protein
MKMILGMVMAVALLGSAQAAQFSAPEMTGSGSIILIEGGCGPGGHRDYNGYCRSNYREWDYGRACPPGWHLGSGGRRCWPN